jgi:8-oxo-dGTP pyrophosphatase MutT (NUDIX family)
MIKLAFTLRQSSVIPYRIKDGALEVLLITSTKRKHWIVPKGWIAIGFSAAASAAKESWEEAGVTGRVIMPVFDVYPDHKWGYPCQVEVFLLSVEAVAEAWPEAQKRKRQWLSLTDATNRVTGKALKRLFSKLQTEAALLHFVDT